MGSNFLCGHPHGAYPSPVRRHPPEPEPFPLRVNAINGWPHITKALWLNPFKDHIN